MDNRQAVLHNDITLNTEQFLFNKFQRLEAQYKLDVDIAFQSRINLITAGYAWMTKCVQRANYASFGASLNTHPIYRHYDPSERRKWCETIGMIKKVYENWDDIYRYLNHPAITHIHMKELSIRQLSRLTTWDDVLKYNDDHAPRAPRRRQRPLYPRAFITEITQHIQQNTTILHDIDFEEEQIKMIGRDISNELLRIAANR